MYNLSLLPQNTDSVVKYIKTVISKLSGHHRILILW